MSNVLVKNPMIVTGGGSQPNLQSKYIQIYNNGSTTYYPQSDNCDGYSQVDVYVDVTPPSPPVAITQLSDSNDVQCDCILLKVVNNHSRYGLVQLNSNYSTTTSLNSDWGSSLYQNCSAVLPFAFYGNQYLQTLNYNVSSLTYNEPQTIGAYAFAECSALTTATITCGNEWISTVDTYAFKNCTNLTTATIRTAALRFGVFYGCSSLNSVTLQTISYIDRCVFDGCNDLYTINYTGTMDQWNNITKHSEWRQGCSIDLIHCTDGDINL